MVQKSARNGPPFRSQIAPWKLHVYRYLIHTDTAQIRYIYVFHSQQVRKGISREKMILKRREIFSSTISIFLKQNVRSCYFVHTKFSHLRVWFQVNPIGGLLFTCLLIKLLWVLYNKVMISLFFLDILPRILLPFFVSAWA